jgi:hypothetical protein
MPVRWPDRVPRRRRLATLPGETPEGAHGVRQVRHVGRDIGIVHHRQRQAVPAFGQHRGAHRRHRPACAATVIHQQHALRCRRVAKPLGRVSGAIEADHRHGERKQPRRHGRRHHAAAGDPGHHVRLPLCRPIQQGSDHPLGLIITEENRHLPRLQSLPLLHLLASCQNSPNHLHIIALPRTTFGASSWARPSFCVLTTSSQVWANPAAGRSGPGPSPPNA